MTGPTRSILGEVGLNPIPLAARFQGCVKVAWTTPGGGPSPPAPLPILGEGRKKTSFTDGNVIILLFPLSQYWERGLGGEGPPPVYVYLNMRMTHPWPDFGEHDGAVLYSPFLTA